MVSKSLGRDSISTRLPPSREGTHKAATSPKGNGVNGFVKLA
ncbi:MAG: hypothetical protein P8N62_02130 [Alphaproteobacteria bacterium]|nr:hypothetical protein [Alphaproteobacteria bacterium]